LHTKKYYSYNFYYFSALSAMGYACTRRM